MLPRMLEPEVMDDSQEASEYDAMDHSEVNRRFAEDFLAGGIVARDILDLGTGTALIPTVICRLQPDVRVMASDASINMLELARYNIEIEGLRNRIQLHHGDAKKLGFENDSFDAVVSNSLLHHLPEPLLGIQEMVRVTRPGGRLFVRDLMRPESADEVERLVDLYTVGATDFAKQLFRQSLHAALTLAEIRALVSDVGFDPNSVAATTDRHWTWNCVKQNTAA